jgi:hypothetical protein
MRFLSQLVQETGHFWHCFCTFWKAWKAYLTSLTPSTTAPWPETPPTNSWRTKQFLSRPHGI